MQATIKIIQSKPLYCIAYLTENYAINWDIQLSGVFSKIEHRFGFCHNMQLSDSRMQFVGFILRETKLNQLSSEQRNLLSQGIYLEFH